MRSWMWLFIVVALVGLIGADDVVNSNLKPVSGINWKLTHQYLNLNHHSTSSKAALEYPEYLGAHADTVGWTYYDMQHNYTCGRNIAVDAAGGIHIVWMRADEATFADRHIHYNYINPEGTMSNDPTMTIPVESSDRGGYTTIALAQLPPLFDTSATTVDVPVVAFHAIYSSLGSDPHTDIVWDGVYRLVGESAHGGFGGTESGSPLPGSGSLPPIAYTNTTQYEDYHPEFYDCSRVEDVAAIWPVIATDGENVYLASTNSLHDTVNICGTEFGSWIIFHAGTPEYDASDFISYYSFGDPILLDEQTSITVDIAVDYESGALAAVYQHEGHPNSCPDSLAGSHYPEEFVYRTSTDNGVTWSERQTIIGYSGTVPEFDDLDTFLTPSVYWDTISAAETVWVANIDTYYVAYNPNAIVSAIYVDGVLHVAMETWMFAYSSDNPYDEDPCHPYYLLGTAIIYWNSEDGEIVPIARFAYGRPSYITYNNATYVNAFEHSLDPSIAADDEGNLFITWDQCWADVYDFYRDTSYINWIYANAGTLDADQLAEYDSLTSADSVFIDQSSAGIANEDIYGVASRDGGRSWSEPYNISQTYSWGAEPGECLSELNTSLALKVDDYLHIFTVLDLDAGENLRDCGTAVNDPILHIAIPKDSLLNRAEETVYCRSLYPLNATYTSNTEQPIVMYINDPTGTGIDPSSISLIVNGTTYSVDSPELTLSSDTLIFIPTTDLSEGIVDVNLESYSTTDGTSGIPYSFHFFTDYTAPSVDSVYPLDGDTVRTTSPTIRVIIGETGSGVNADSLRFIVNGIEVMPRIDNSESGAVATYTPDTPFDDSSVVSVSVVDIQDAVDYGEPNMADDYDWSFVIATENISDNKIPQKISLNISPNPFNSAANIVWSSPISGHATVKIIDLTGKTVSTLYSGYITSGPHTMIWNGSDDNGNTIPSGTYMCKLSIGNNIVKEKITLMK